MVAINSDACTGCGQCVRDCVGGVLSLKEGKAAHNGRCILCGHCVAVCPTNAVSIPEYDMDGVEERPAASLDPKLLLSVIKARRSIRDYEPRPVPEEAIRQIIEAGRYTATAVNRQDCRFILVQKELPAFKELIWEGIAAVIRENGDSPALRPYQNFYAWRRDDPAHDFLFRNAPAVLFVACDRPLDAGLCAQNMELMAVSLGLGMLYNGYLQRAAGFSEKTLEWLGAGDRRISACMLLGYPAICYRRTAPRRKADLLLR